MDTPTFYCLGHFEFSLGAAGTIYYVQFDIGALLSLLRMKCLIMNLFSYSIVEAFKISTMNSPH